MEALVRDRGGYSMSYHRYGASDNQLQSAYFNSTPIQLDPDNLAIGTDFREKDQPDLYFNGDIGVLLLYNQSLSTNALLQIAGSFGKCYGWSVPGMTCGRA